ncbi:MAG: DMT family transporter [Anaerolineae bacterium]|nr:DMT family transporter [Anaerolineae bacterium]
MQPDRLAGSYFALIWGILALTFSSLFVRWADAPGIVTSFYRMLIASIVFGPMVGVIIVKEKIRLSKEIMFPILAGISSGLDHGFWSTAIDQTQVANATLLNNIAPVWVVLFSVIVFRERPSIRFWLGFIFTLTGAIIVFGNNLINNPQFSRGDALALISSIWYAGYFLLSQEGRKKLPAIVFVGLASIVGCITLSIATVGSGIPLTGYSADTYLMFLGAGLLSQVTGYFALVYALGRLPAAIVSPSMVTQPVLTALLAIPLLGEALSAFQIIGGLITLLGVFIINNIQNRGVPVSEIQDAEMISREA